MDADLEETLADEMARLAGPKPRANSTALTYKEHLASWWRPYATDHGLPPTFERTTAPVAATDLLGLIVACEDGTVRRGTKDGDRDRTGTPLAPGTVDELLAALRAAHVDVGLPWAGEDQTVRDAVAGYHRVHGKPPMKAAPMTVGQVREMFIRCPSDRLEMGTDLAAARAVAVALDLPFLAVARLRPDSITWSPEGVTAQAPDGLRTVGCLAAELDDPIAPHACGHCILGAWLTEPAGPLLHEGLIARAQASARRIAAALPAANYTSAHLSADDFWTTIALGLPATATTWLRMRATLLPMRALGLRLDDIERLESCHVRLHESTVTVSIKGKTEDSASPHSVTLTPTGGPLCPVRAIRTYESWVRAYQPDRRRWMLAERGKGTVRRPVDIDYPPASRALYQSVRLWLAEQAVTLNEHDANTRATLTPHSARRGFAQQGRAEGVSDLEIQKALRHTRPTTTRGYLDAPVKCDPAARILRLIVDGENEAKEQ